MATTNAADENREQPLAEEDEEFAEMTVEQLVESLDKLRSPLGISDFL